MCDQSQWQPISILLLPNLCEYDVRLVGHSCAIGKAISALPIAHTHRVWRTNVRLELLQSSSQIRPDW